MYFFQEATGECVSPTWGCKPKKCKALDSGNREYKEETRKENLENNVEHQVLRSTSSNWSKTIQVYSRNLKDKRTVRLPNIFSHIKGILMFGKISILA